MNTDAYDQGDYAWHEHNINHSTSSWKTNPGTYSKNAHTMDSAGLVFHHTVRRYDQDEAGELGTAKRWAREGKGIGYLIGRDGTIYKILPDNMSGIHVGFSNPNGGPISQAASTQLAKDNNLGNRNTQSVELVAKDDSDVTPEQIAASIRLAKHLGYSNNQVYSHTELKHGQNEFEGMSAVNAIKGIESIPMTEPTAVTG